MVETKKLVKEYNKLAIALPDKVWSRRFAHPRMEMLGTRVIMEYNIVYEGKLIPQREPVAVADLPAEIQRLKRRAITRG